MKLNLNSLRFLTYSFLILGLIAFFIGFHNVDSAMNFSEHNIIGYDIGIFSNYMTYVEIYLMGIRQLFASLVCFIGMFFTLMAHLSQIKDY